MANPDVIGAATVNPLLANLGVFDQPTFAATLADERRSGLAFE
jgi:hypothetical protein